MDRPGTRGHRKRAALGAIVVAIVVAAAGVTVYDAAHPKAAGGPLPTIWTLGRTGCSQCSPSTTLVTADSSDLYVLQQGNISDFGNVSYELAAYNWSTGDKAWPSISIEVGEGVLGLAESAFDGHADLVTEGNVVAMVSLGTWVYTSGQLFGPVPTLCGLRGWVMEWNETTGEFLGTQRSACVSGFGFAAIYLAAADGWIGVGLVQDGNLTVSTFSTDPASSSYSEWNTTVNTSVAAHRLFVTAGLSMTAGEVSVVLMGDVDAATVLNGRSGALVWQGTLPDLYTLPGNATFSLLPTVVGEFSNVVQVGHSFYYLANETGITSLNAFDFASNTTVTLAPLSSAVHPINSDLSLLDNRTLVVTDAAEEHYWAFSLGGAPLWNLTLPTEQTSTTGTSGVEGIDFTPFALGGSYALVASMWSSDFASYSGTDYPVATFTVPLAIVDSETGREIWSSSYAQSITFAPTQGYPVSYWPLLTQGRFAAVAYYPGNGLGWSLSIAEFPAVPS